ncbi:hypothetical protein JL722_8761 [Aureococcus anophagefferens]|nr:hypothetical protein JL722_8761 [Aureococcus anophagefferens]
MPSLGGVVANLKSDEWELRVDGLKQLQALGEGATSAEGRKALAASLKGEGVADLVTKQLRDLRSVVAATACRCAAALAKALGAEGTQPLCGVGERRFWPSSASVAAADAQRAHGLPRRRDGETRAVGAVVGGRGGPAAGPAAAPEVAAPRSRRRGRRRPERAAGEGDDASAAVLVNALAEQCCSPHWDLRRDGVVALRSALASPRVAASSGDGVAWRSLAEATHDAHHKVNLAALEALAATLRGCSDAVAGEAFSARVLDPGQFDGAATVLGCAAVGAAKRLVDPRQPTRHAAGQALHELRRTFAPAVLLEGVAPARPLPPLKARLHEFAAAVARVDGDAGRRGFFDDAARLGDVVLRVARTLDQTPTGARRRRRAAFAAAARLAVAVRRCDAEAFRTAARRSPPSTAAVGALRDLARLRRAAQRARRRHVARRAAPAEVLADAPPPPPPAAGGPPPPAPGGGVTGGGAKTLSDAVAVLSRPGGGGGAAADAGRAARGDVARLARLAGPAVDAAWRGYRQPRAPAPRRASAPADGGRDAFLEGDESDDSDDGRSPGDRGGLRRAPTMSLDDLAARHESLGALRTLARRRPRDFRFCLDAAVPRLLALSRDGKVPLELAWARASSTPAAAAAAALPRSRCPTSRTRRRPRARRPDVARLDLQRSRALCRPRGLRARASGSARGALPSALPPLSSAAGAPAADVRKAAVDALVELYVALGYALVPKLKLHLRDDQVKLVGMFVHKRAATKAAAAAA